MRASGLLLPIFSLPGKHGIGCFSEEAYRFVDFVKEAGQKYWQILPVGPTGYGDSPYQSFSAFAGNPYFISPDALEEAGLLTEAEAAEAVYDGPADSISYAWLYNTRYPLLRRAYRRWKEQEGAEEALPYKDFLRDNASWLPDYALFMALKDAHGGAGFREWEEPVRMRKPEAIEKAREELRDEIGFHLFLQYIFEQEWMKLKAYANQEGISIIGDIPIYVPADSAEVWAYPELFQLKEDGSCKAVAGCPPDGFSATGQLWGNPLYDWKHHEKTGYAWWISRMRRCSSLFDVVRIDHFRGFDQYYAIPAESWDARIGQWEEGPGIGLFRAIEKEIPGLTIIAGTHDNETMVGWLDHILPEERAQVRAFTGLDGGEGDEWAFGASDDTKRLARAMVRAAMASVGRLCVIPMQDWLLLGDEARINTPSTTGTNWCWRMAEGAASQSLAEQIRRMTETFGR